MLWKSGGSKKMGMQEPLLLDAGDLEVQKPSAIKVTKKKKKMSKKMARVIDICFDVGFYLLVLVGLTGAGWSIYNGVQGLVQYYRWSNCERCCSSWWSWRWDPMFNCNVTESQIEWADECDIRLVESIPQGLTFDEPIESTPTYQAFEDLIRNAQFSIQIASSYWSLRGLDTNTTEEPTTDKGETVFRLLAEAATERGVKVQIAQDLPKPSLPSLDTMELAKLDNVEVKTLNFTHLVGNGILHTKMMLVDGTSFYVGGNNFDWRSFTQVKEMGVLARGCPILGRDMQKLFEIYWMVGGPNKTIPETWPAELDTRITDGSPLKVPSMELDVYLSSSPRNLRTCHRMSDLSAILAAIERAESFVHIAVMDYFPIFIYNKPGERSEFWPFIDYNLRRAAIERGIEVRLLLSNWTHTRSNMKNYLRSLTSINQPKQQITVQGRFFTVPANASQSKIPFARVNHNKYIVTDKEAMVMTSNWSADYFEYTGGIGFWFSPSANTTSSGNMLTQLQNVFDRDWNSPYASQDV